MKRKQQEQPEFTIDADGQRLAHVALANTDLRATLYAEDYRRLMNAGFSPHWQYAGTSHGNAYVTLNAYTSDGYNRAVPVARLLTAAGHGERVRARDGNTLNLRAENLEFYMGRAWFNADDWHPTAAAAQAAGVTMKRKPRLAPARALKASSETAQMTKSKRSCRPVRPAVTAGRLQAPHEPAREYTPHVRDTAATSARVRAMLAAGTP